MTRMVGLLLIMSGGCIYYSSKKVMQGLSR